MSARCWAEQEQGFDSMQLPVKRPGNHESKYPEANTQLSRGTHDHKMPLGPRALQGFK